MNETIKWSFSTDRCVRRCQRIAYEEKIPVALFSGGKHPVLAIPASHQLKTADYHLSPDVATLKPRLDHHRLSLGAMADGLQCSRGRSTAESSVPIIDGKSYLVASMQPRSFNRGKQRICS